LNKKLNNKIIDEKLINRNIKRVGNYINNKTKIDFQCLIENCNHVWKTTIKSILNMKTGCPKCAGVVKMTNKDIDNKLFILNIKKNDSYINMITSINFQCLIESCNYIWRTSPNNIINNGSRCPKCSNRCRYTNEIVDSKLLPKNIKRLDNYFNNKIPIRFQCLIDNYIWKTSLGSILHMGSGCPKCSNTAKLTNENIDIRLSNRNIKRIDNIINSSTSLNFKCETCNYIWETTPNNISRRGCPKCNIPGYNEKLMHSIFEKNNIIYELQYCIKKIDKTAPSYKFDAFSIIKQIAIEYNGKQHYIPTGFGNLNPEQDFIKQQNRDEYVRNFCLFNNIKLIEIDGRDFYEEKLEQFLLKNVVPMLK